MIAGLASGVYRKYRTDPAIMIDSNPKTEKAYSTINQFLRRAGKPFMNATSSLVLLTELLPKPEDSR